MDATPDPVAVRDTVQTGLDAGELVTMFGRCRVEYDGRASSTLGPGDRLLVLKPDGTALVHTDEGHQPVNWQPPGCEHEIRLSDGTLRVHSSRTTPEETLDVCFETVTAVNRYAVTDDSELSVSGTEADLRERVLESPSLVESGFEPRATERETAAGAIDIYGVDERGNAVVVELKRRRVGPDAVGQLDRYVTALRRESHDETTVRGLLVAPSVTDRASELLADRGLEFVALEPHS